MELTARILVVDDEDNVRESLRLILSRRYEVICAESGLAALDKLKDMEQALSGSSMPNLMVIDVLMPGLDGLGLLEKVNEQYPGIPVIMLTASTAVKNAVRAMKLGAVDYLSKPFDVDELMSLVEATLRDGPSDRNATSLLHSNGSQRIGLADVPGDFGCLVGRSAPMLELYRRIEQVGIRDTTVLLTGESGSGKELVAREIHRHSSRANSAFVALNCAAIPETLIESELFGHEKGAFTHAIERRVGHFELADKGTLLLDEIGELSMPVQVKMLRFLQQQEFYRLGRSKPTKVDVRVIAATNRSLDQAIAAGTFREDLYYRINVVSIELPPLRERKDDIPILIEYFMKRFAPVYGGRRASMSGDAMDVLMRYDWPGNVRELENVTESVLALSNTNEISTSDLPNRIRASTKSRSSKDDILTGSVSFEEAERVFETDIIVKALQSNAYVQTKAAEMLGISRRILKYKMDKLGISDKAPSS